MAETLINPLVALVAGSALGIAGVDAARRVQRLYARLLGKNPN